MPDDSSQPILRFDDVTLSFGGPPVLNHISFSVLPGETRIIFGAAGSGKTILLKTALGLLRPDTGRVYVFGHDITRMPERDLFDIRSRIGMLFQEGALFDSLTIEENVCYPLLNQKSIRSTPEQARARAEEVLRFVELEHTMDKRPSELSGGMRRRVGIARAVATRPPLVLYDSPTAGLDPITANTIIAVIVKQRDVSNVTTLMVTHRYQDGNLMANYRWDAATGGLRPATNGERARLRTTFMVLREGRLVFEGTQQELEASEDPYVSRFVVRST
jgi:phospholipid/cholesterol/gamma-HCH transport system ATP-binding protein